MSDHIDYYCSLNSPWSYLGHDRLAALAARHDKQVVIWPTDYSIVFPVTGGLPLPKRAPARQAYRLVELRRWRDHLGIALEIQPAHWPVDEVTAASMVIALREMGHGDAAFALAGDFMRAVWAEQRDIANRDTMAEIAAARGLDAQALLAEADSGRPAALRAERSRAAIERGVFGAPTYVYRDEPFWGQDRLDFLTRALA